MRITLLILIFFLPVFSFGQSPFNYGQNKNVYFISTELRKQLGINTIYSVDQKHDNEFGGMGENWDVTVISFDTNSVEDDWCPLKLNNTFKYNLDTLIDQLQPLNGVSYEFSNGQLISHGGHGYGTFDWKDVIRFSDTL